MRGVFEAHVQVIVINAAQVCGFGLGLLLHGFMQVDAGKQDEGFPENSIYRHLPGCRLISQVTTITSQQRQTTQKNNTSLYHWQEQSENKATRVFL